MRLRIALLTLVMLLSAPVVRAQTNLTTGTNNLGNSLTQFNFDLTGSAQEAAFTVTESSASSVSGSPVYLVNLSTLTGSTLVPLAVQQAITGSQNLPTVSVLPTWNTTGNVLGAFLYERHRFGQRRQFIDDEPSAQLRDRVQRGQERERYIRRDSISE